MTSNIRECGPILLAGGCGYLGHRILLWLVNEVKVPVSNLAVLDLANPHSQFHQAGVSYFQADLTDQESVEHVLQNVRPTAIFHTASPRPFIGTLDFYMHTNVDGARNLLESALRCSSVKAYVYTSSSSVVHDSVSNMVEADESYPLLFIPQQLQPYHHSKAVAEQLALSYNRKRPDFVIAAVRPSAMFGPHEDQMIPSIVSKAKSGSLRFQIGDGTNEADLTYVDNTVYAHVLCLEGLLKAVEAGPNALPTDMVIEGEPFTITNDVHPNFWNFARQVGAAAGYPIDPKKIVAVPKSLALNIATLVEWCVWLFSLGRRTALVKRADLNYSTITRTFDISKAKKRLGYRPLFSIAQGIELAVAPLIGHDKKA